MLALGGSWVVGRGVWYSELNLLFTLLLSTLYPEGTRGARREAVPYVGSFGGFPHVSPKQHNKPGRDYQNHLIHSPRLKTPKATARKQAAAQRRAQQINMVRHRGVVTKVASCNARYYRPRFPKVGNRPTPEKRSQASWGRVFSCSPVPGAWPKNAPGRVQLHSP